MGILLWVVGALALGSGAVKQRAGARALVGRAPLALAEICAGGAVALGAGVGLARLRPLAWSAVIVTLVLLLVSTVAHGRRIARRGAEQAASAEQRLREHLGMPDA
jgi:hypothetical protein